MCDFDSWLEEIEAEEIAASILLIPAAANSNVSSQIGQVVSSEQPSGTILEATIATNVVSHGVIIVSNEQSETMEHVVATIDVVRRTTNDQDNETAGQADGLEEKKPIEGGDNDEAGPSSMAPSALSGGSTKTSAPLIVGDLFTPQFTMPYCLGCPRSDCSHSLPSDSEICQPCGTPKSQNVTSTDDITLVSVTSIAEPVVPFIWTTEHQQRHEAYQQRLGIKPAAVFTEQKEEKMKEDLQSLMCRLSPIDKRLIVPPTLVKTNSPSTFDCEVFPYTYSPPDQMDAGEEEEEEESIDEFLATLMSEHIRTPIEIFDNMKTVDISEEVYDDEVLTGDKGGRKSAEDGKNVAFKMPVMEALNAISLPCNHLCPLSGYCTKNISAKPICDFRKTYFLDDGEPAPKDKQRAQLIMGYLKKARKDKDNNIIFLVDNQEVCTPAFLRILGVMTSADMTKTPGQWQRLIKGYLKSEDDEYLLTEADLKKDNAGEFLRKRGHATAFINEIAAYFSDTIPAVTTEDGETKTMVVPYRHATDLFREYEYHCDALGIGIDTRASYPTFVRACNPLIEAKVVKFLGGKSGFQTCSICNNTLAIKQSACCKRDTVTRDALLKVSSLHLSQQATERQFAENFSAESEKVEDGQPVQAHIDFDGQSTWVGNTPKYSKDWQSGSDLVIENRNIGLRIVCGPVKEYISVCTNNLIPHGANVLVEVLKYAIEYFARRLMEFGMVLPKKLGVQGDNSGENKNKEMFCYLSHLIEECYFEEIELFFLIVGHTHNILDQWFGVLSRAIRGASFIGSYLAMHELYKIAHQDDEADLRPQNVHQLELYHDWRRFYNALRNDEIHNYNIPHRFKITLDQMLKVAKMQYMFMSPPFGFRHLEKWQPVPSQADLKTGNINGDIPLSPFVIFNGPGPLLKALGAPAQTNFTDLAVGDNKIRTKAASFEYIMPVLRQIEVRAIGESAVRMQQEADRGESDEFITLTPDQIKRIDKEITNSNSSKGGRIVWLRRSKIANDPDYLNRRPDILPNPKLWRERIANAPPASTHDDDSSALASTRPKRSAEEKAKAKKDTADAKEAQQRLISFQKGASEIALTATYVLKLLDDEDDSSWLKMATSNNIVEATKKFTKTALTPREVKWYRSVQTAKDIARRQEAMVEAAEKEPWALLNLPVETPEQKAHRDALLDARKKRIIQLEANFRKILMRDGEGEYDPDRQVVSMDGFVPAQTQDIDKMIRPQLEALAKGHMKTSEIKKLKVDQLRAAVKKLLEKNPNLIQIPNGGSSSYQLPTDDVYEVVARPDTDVDANAISNICMVLECDSESPLEFCDDCGLHFCSELHGPHRSHSMQMLRLDRVAKRSVEYAANEIVDDNLTVEDSIAPEAIQPTTIERDTETTLITAEEDVQSLPKRQKRVHISATSVTVAYQDVIEPEVTLSLEVPMRSVDDNPVSRQSWELDKLKDAVEFIRSQLNEGENRHDTRSNLLKKFNYSSCYDIIFLKTLANEFNIDLSPSLSKKRPQIKEVLTCFIDSLLL